MNLHQHELQISHCIHIKILIIVLGSRTDDYKVYALLEPRFFLFYSETKLVPEKPSNSKLYEVSFGFDSYWFNWNLYLLTYISRKQTYTVELRPNSHRYELVPVSFTHPFVILIIDSGVF